MGGMALGRKAFETGESFQLKEMQYPYIAHFGMFPIFHSPEVGSKTGGLFDFNNGQVGPVLVGGWVHSRSTVAFSK